MVPSKWPNPSDAATPKPAGLFSFCPRWNLPKSAVRYPAGSRILGVVISKGEHCDWARVAGVRGEPTLVRIGKRPVKKQVRLGEHSGMAQKFVKLTPCAAIASQVGVDGSPMPCGLVSRN